MGIMGKLTIKIPDCKICNMCRWCRWIEDYECYMCIHAWCKDGDAFVKYKGEHRKGEWT